MTDNKKQCLKHPDATMLSIDVLGQTLYRCPECEKEIAKREAEKKEIERTERIKTKLDKANIPLRLKEKTLDNFVTLTNDQKEVKKIALEFIDNYPNAVGSAGLILIGNTCTGKSHLACGILQEMIKRYEIDGGMLETTKLFRLRREQEKESWLLNDLRTIDLLVLEINIDNTANLTSSQAEFLKEIIIDRYNSMQPTIIVSSFNIPELRFLFGDALIEKFKGANGKVLIFSWDSYFKNK